MPFEDPYSSDYDPARQCDHLDKIMGQGKYRDDPANWGALYDKLKDQIQQTKEQLNPGKMDNEVKLSDYDRHNIQAILHGEGDWFTAKLLRLIANADKQSKRQIYKGFPDAVDAVHKHQTGKTWTEGEL